MEFLRQHQLDIMLVLIGICGILSFLVLVTKTLSRNRKCALFSLELSALFLLICDRFKHIYNGNISMTSFWVVRICHFLAFLFSLTILYAFNNYLVDLFKTGGKLSKIPRRFKISRIIVLVGIFSLVVSQFTHFYYFFDEKNCFVNGRGIVVSYVFPFIALILQCSVLIQYHKKLRRLIGIPLVVFTIFPFLATGVELFVYDVSFTDMVDVGMAVLLYIFNLIDLNDTVENTKQREIDLLTKEQKNIWALFEQTATALANAIDAKDEYTHGHSMRVAEYSQKIAKLSGKDEKFCRQVYFAGLLHDVGKIGIPISIITKAGKLTEEEYEEIKHHPSIGKQILSSINKVPYLAIGANYHHERYDGHGYPERLKGDDIPELARIIAVADAYDAMTSKRSYREPISQQKVREEIVKGMGYQFDPTFAKIMLYLIDMDTEYQMKEKEEVLELAGKNELVCIEPKSAFSAGFLLNTNITKFKLHCKAQEDVLPKKAVFSFLIFDSLDGQVHYDDSQTKEMVFAEFAKINFDGSTQKMEARKVQADITKNEEDWTEAYKKGIDFEGEAVKYKDHVLIKLNCKYQKAVITIALPDSSRFTYLSLTGAHCVFSKVDFSKTKETIDQNYIPRIAEEISYIDSPAGDIPNVQIDGWCAAASQAVLVKDDMTISFHAKSLPAARLIWHCPYISFFYADDKKHRGKNFKEYVLVRIDGENWEGNSLADNSIVINKSDDFESWTEWKEMNKKGFDCTVHIHRVENKITVTTENGGISIKSITTIKEMPPEIYVTLTGDQCAITNIRIQGQ